MPSASSSNNVHPSLQSRSPKMNLILGVHNHQPVDNWDHVIEDAYQKCYQPFLDVLEAHPGVKMSIHYTGYLLDWLVNHHPALIEQLGRLIQRNQVEMFTGGYYEPILPTIPDAHKVGQILKLTRRVEELTGSRPRGLWLAERVWEPQLAQFLSEAEVEYLFVDDAHFKSVGLEDHDLLGRYTTEEQGKMVDIFPVSKDLRYLIPYAKPQEIVDYLENLADAQGHRVGIYFDDGEKFGVWPGTYKSVYREKWLDKFFTALEKNQEVIQCVTPSEYVDKIPSFGRIYLPTASYSEMLEWSLPSPLINQFELALHEAPESAQRFLRGGFWRHFMVKYPESNNIHKKMLYVSQKIQHLQGQSPSKLSDDGQLPEVLESALNEIWMGQSNDVLWHGVFGGLYLTNLRTANYQHLLKAENIVDKALRGDRFFEIKTHDIDCDGQPEILIETQVQNLYLTPQDGGALFELDFRPRNFNLLDTLARRYEAYHDKLSQAVFSEGGEADSAESIHHRVVTKEKGLEKILFYDAHRRMSLMDHFWGPGTDLDQVFQNTCSEVGDFIGKPYAVDVQRDHVSLERAGYLQGADGAYTPVSVKKTLWVDKDKAETLIRYEIKSLQEKTSETPIDVWFSPEFNVNFLAPDAPDRYYYVPETTSTGGSDTKPADVGSAVAVQEKPLVKLKSAKMVSRGSLEAVESIGLRDEWMGIDYALFFNQPTTVWRFPVETVSQSEAGFEKIYQSSALYPNWQFKLAPQQTWTVDIRQRILAV